MAELLLPYAYDCNDELVHVDNAQKGHKYFCPTCGAELLLRKSNIPEGQKYHRRSHFAHKGVSDNHCSESFLHNHFKQKCADYICKKISKQEELIFEWECEKCLENHNGNLLKKAVDVKTEYDMGICRPDIALLDKDGKVVIVVEVVVTHKPEPEVLDYYEKKKIACLQLVVKDFSECDNVAQKLSHPNEVSVCPTPICGRCGKYKRKTTVCTVFAKCRKCDKQTKIAIKTIGKEFFNPNDFNEKELNIAKSAGANVKKKYSKSFQQYYYVNECSQCRTVFGDMRDIHLPESAPHLEEFDLGYECPYCAEDRMLKEVEGYKRCPVCQGFLRIKTGPYGQFWGCEHYPECKYTESKQGLGWSITDDIPNL